LRSSSCSSLQRDSSYFSLRYETSSSPYSSLSSSMSHSQCSSIDSHYSSSPQSPLHSFILPLLTLLFSFFSILTPLFRLLFVSFFRSTRLIAWKQNAAHSCFTMLSSIARSATCSNLCFELSLPKFLIFFCLFRSSSVRAASSCRS
ncbi:hypothetical protein PMAYCL1PPCAC_18784, partial [Pristionchus mayeri]